MQEKERRDQAMIRQVVSVPRDEYTIPVLTEEEYKDLLYRAGTLRPINEVPVAHTYLYSRGFTEADLCTLHSAGVRYSDSFGREVYGKEKHEGRPWRGRPAIVFPVRGGDNSLVACQGRFIDPRGNLPKVLTFGHRAYGLFKTFVSLENETRQIGVCEAPLDALALAVKGTPSVALCGCTGLPKWFLHQSHGRRFLIATDADEAGDTAALKLSRELKQVGAYTARLRPSPQKDFADMLLHGTLLPLANQEEVKEFTRVLKILLANDSEGIVQSLVSQMAGMDQAAQEAVDTLDLMIAEWRMVNNV
jgi:DNA primase